MKGVSTVEVLIAMLICGLVVLAVAGKQLGMMSYMQHSYYQHVASEEALRITQASGKSCSSASIHNWQLDVAKKLPGGKALIEHDGSDTIVSIKWYLDNQHEVAQQITYRMV